MTDETKGIPLNAIKNQLQDLINEIKPLVNELLGESAQGINVSAKNMMDKGITYAKENPVAALLSAFSLGFLLTAWLKRK